jgi:hypothetical protein
VEYTFTGSICNREQRVEILREKLLNLGPNFLTMLTAMTEAEPTSN